MAEAMDPFTRPPQRLDRLRKRSRLEEEEEEEEEEDLMR
jgi:hypothetical protein